MAEAMTSVEQVQMMQEETLAAHPEQSSVIMFKWGSKQKPFRCQLCDMLFENGESLRDHMAKHTDIQPAKPYPCKICPKSFQTSKSLERHCLIHYGQALKRCKFCYKVFANKENLDKHVAIHDGKKPFKCGQCGDQFVFRQGLESHMIIHTGVRPYVCQICNKGFNRKDILERHMIVHSGDKKHKCVECGKHFAHSFVLKRHTRRVHSQEFNGEECEICGKYIKSKENIRRHMKLHSGERPYKCSICEKSFTQKQHAIDHMVIHSNEHPYKCNYCEKDFKYKRSLNRHVAWHEGREKWKCEFPGCEMTYNSRVNLNRHMLVHKKNKQQCTVCMAVFNSKAALKRHLILGHKDVTMYREIGVGTDDLNDIKESVKRIMGSNDDIICKTILGKDHTYKFKEPKGKTDEDKTKDSETDPESKENSEETEKSKEEIILIVLENDGQRQIMVEGLGKEPSVVMQMADGTTQEVQDLSGDDRSQLIQTLLDFAEQQTGIGTVSGPRGNDDEKDHHQAESNASASKKAETVEQETDSNGSADGIAETVNQHTDSNASASKNIKTVVKHTGSSSSDREDTEMTDQQKCSDISTEMVEEPNDSIATSADSSEEATKRNSEAEKEVVNRTPLSETPKSMAVKSKQTTFIYTATKIDPKSMDTREQSSLADGARRIVKAARNFETRNTKNGKPEASYPETTEMETEETVQAPSAKFARVDNVHDYAKAPNLQIPPSDNSVDTDSAEVMTVINSEDGSEIKLEIYQGGTSVA